MTARVYPSQQQTNLTTIGSLLVSYDEVNQLTNVSQVQCYVNSVERKLIHNNNDKLYSTFLSNGDIVRVLITTTSNDNEISVSRRDYTTDDQGGDMGIRDVYITGVTGNSPTTLEVTFTATTISLDYNFEYLVTAIVKYPPTPTPTPTITPTNTVTPTPTNTLTPTPTISPTNTAIPSGSYFKLNLNTYSNYTLVSAYSTTPSGPGYSFVINGVGAVPPNTVNNGLYFGTYQILVVGNAQYVLVFSGTSINLTNLKSYINNNGAGLVEVPPSYSYESGGLTYIVWTGGLFNVVQFFVDWNDSGAPPVTPTPTPTNTPTPTVTPTNTVTPTGTPTPTPTKIIYPQTGITSGATIYVNGTSESYPGTGTTWYDTTTTTPIYNGTLTNGPVWSGGTPSYFTFDGVNDWVNFGLSSSGSTTGRFMFGGWVKTTTSATDKVFFMRGEGNDLSDGWSLCLYKDSNNKIAASAVLVNLGTTQINAIGTTTLVDNTWYYVMAWFSQATTGTATTQIRIYVNGVYEGGGYTPRRNLRSSTFGWKIARGNGTYTDCSVSEFQQYSFLLTDQQIANNFNGTKTKFGY